MDSGATTIRKSGEQLSTIVPRVPQEKDEKTICIFWAYTQKNSAIASGATPIGSTGHAPDDNG
jgi:hypothetical protein